MRMREHSNENYSTWNVGGTIDNGINFSPLRQFEPQTNETKSIEKSPNRISQSQQTPTELLRFILYNLNLFPCEWHTIDWHAYEIGTA